MNQQDSVIVKFKPVSLNAKLNVADHLNNIVGKHIFDTVEKMFPDEPDTDLGSIYIAKISGNQMITQVIDSLNKEKDIDYAHLPSNRKGF